MAFLQSWMSGISGLPGAMVRPRWQTEPPNIPQAGECWAALGVRARPSDEYPYVGHLSMANGGIGADLLQRHETLDILTSFYDTGVTGQADFYAAQFRDGTAIQQNRDPLILAGMGLVRVGSLVTVPSLLKLRWLYRVDLEVTIRRQIDRVYPVENLVAAQGSVITEEGLPPVPFSVPSGG